MAGEAYPGEIADLDGDSEALHCTAGWCRSRGFISSVHVNLPRGLAAWACRVIGGLFVHCLCDGNPPALAEFSSRDDRREAARAHPGTCGVAQTDVIAGVETEAVEQTPLAGSRSEPPHF